MELEWLSYGEVKELWQYGDGETDGQTDRIAISVSRVCVVTRDEKWANQYWVDT